MNFLRNILKKQTKPIKSYQEFWDWFKINERNFYNVVKNNGEIEKIFFEPLSEKLNELRDGFFYLTGMVGQDKAELILTADGVVKNIAFVEDLVAAAPELGKWLFTALKPALNFKDVSIHMNGYDFKTANINFYESIDDRFPDEIDLRIIHDDINNTNKDVITIGIQIFLDNLLGELNFATIIDSLDIISKPEALQELVPIEKLKDFLIWRQKEFIEKYESVKRNTEDDSYSMLEAKTSNGSALFAAINTGLLEWDRKASHPWIASIEIKYDGTQSNGLPDNKTYELLNKIEDEILLELTDIDGYLNIGRQTADNVREIYFACKEFRLPSKVLHQMKQSYSNLFEIDYIIYKDKYWQSFDRFITV